MKRYIILFFILVSLLLLKTSHANTNNVMGPLWLESDQQWQDFTQQLAIAKGMGIDGVSIDVWWGAVEGEADQTFIWDYYDRIFALIIAADLRITPIMSFHQCGGNVGDNCDVPIPSWIWNHNADITAQDLMYKSEQGYYSKEYVSLWADTIVMPQYQEFMAAFEHRYGHLAHYIDELNISMGPAGELRYPSYNAHDKNTNYPTRGAFQNYGRLALIDFRRFVADKYKDIDVVNRVWRRHYNRFSDITLPNNMDFFVKSGKHLETQFGQDILSWNHISLMNHGSLKLKTARNSFNTHFRHIDIGYKVAGIHWLKAEPSSLVRSAEYAAGVIPPPGEINKNAPDYYNAINIAARHKTNERNVILHFTCLEMKDNPVAPDYSQAQSLVMTVGTEAQRQGVTVKGENALATGIMSEYGWQNIETAFQTGLFSGITVLRIEPVTSGIGQQLYSEFIQRYKGK